jgi:cell division protease FtsH
MIRDWGMSDRLGFIYYGEDESKNVIDVGVREYSEETAKIIDEEVKKLIDTLFQETRQILEANRDKIEAMAKALLKYETLDTNDIDRIMRGDNLTRPTVGDMIEKEQRRATTIQPGPTATDPDVRPGLGGGPLPAPG